MTRHTIDTAVAAILAVTHDTPWSEVIRYAMDADLGRCYLTGTVESTDHSLEGLASPHQVIWWGSAELGVCHHDGGEGDVIRVRPVDATLVFLRAEPVAADTLVSMVDTVDAAEVPF